MNQQYPIIGECRSYDDIADTHTHDFTQLIIPLQGSMQIQTPAFDFELTDHLFLLPPQCQHTFYAKRNNQFLVLDVTREAYEPTHLVSTPISQKLDEQWQALRFLFLSEINPQIDRPARLGELFSYAYQRLTEETTPLSIQHIHQHYDQPLTVAHLAQLEGYTLTYYSEWFKKRTELTPQAYLQKVRLNKAKTLLRQTDFSILQIALHVGYQHHGSFTRLFQQHEGLSPAAYRRTSRNAVKSS
ncbi:MAG: AraC family transcriptional regulator [Chloroflexota bacterium]